MPIPVELPAAPARERGLLLDAAERVPADAYKADRGQMRWPLEGVTWNPHMYRAPQVAESQCDTVYSKDPTTLDDLATQEPFLLWDSLACGAVSGMRDWMTAELNYSLDTLRSAAFAVELETATASGGLGLIGDATHVPSVVTGSASPLGYAIGGLEVYLAENLNGAVGMIHLTPELLVYAAGESFIYWDGSVYRTHTGHIVTGDAGYMGAAGPFGWPDSGNFEVWIRASSLVWFDETTVSTALSVGGADPGDFDFSNNTEKPLHERHGIVLFEPSVLAAAHVDVSVDAEFFGS